MTRPTARVLALLEVLQGGGTHTAAGLAERLGVDERTVRRYVEHLLDLDMPIEAVRGRYGGFRLVPGFRMPPLMLTDEEALAVLLGLARASYPAAEPAAAKVRRVLPKALGARLDALLETAEFTAPRPAEAMPGAAVMLRVAEATRERRPVVIGYLDRAGRRSDRTVDPYGLVAHRGRWYLSGADSASGEVRTFRLDRVTQVRVAEGTFAPPEGFEPAGAVLASLTETPWRHRVVVRVRGAAEDVRARLPGGLATVEAGEEGWALVRLRAERLDWLPAMLAGLGLPFVVTEPDELRAAVRTWAEGIAAGNRASDPG